MITDCNKFTYHESLSKMDCEIIDILRELCSDFAPYNYLKKFDLYKGALFGGNNVYFKRGVDDVNGMVTTKTNIRIYGLDNFPFNFQSQRDRNGSPEQGWSGETLLNLVRYLQSYKL